MDMCRMTPVEILAEISRMSVDPAGRDSARA
jgi:hypothetical protein